MKLIIIYGPPAVGKLSVGKELSKLTGYKIFHNHLAIDFIESVLDRKNAKFWELLDKYRLELIEIAGKNGVEGLIMTSVHINGPNDKFIKDIMEIMGNNSGSYHFVKLECNIEEMKKRLQNPSRKKHGKLINVDILEKFMSENDVTSEIHFVDSLKIDNTNLSPKKTAKMIKEHYKL
jgi:tRNA uridine 5-carbamoylmethylation protein Kti12